MKILYLTPGLGASGGIRVIFDHCDRLRAKGHDVYLASPEVGRPTWYALSTPVISQREAARMEWEAVVATGWETVRLALALRAQRRFYFVQMMEHLFFGLSSPEYDGALESYRLARDGDMTIITIADWLKTELNKFGLSETVVIPNGVDERLFYREQDEPRDNYILIEGDNRNLAKDMEGVGWRVALSLQERYGLRTVAYSGVIHPYADEMSSFHLRPDASILRGLYARAKLFIKASRFDGLALAPLEAMACGTACCRALLFGDDDLQDGVNCRRVGYNALELFEAACGLLEHPDELEALHAGALEYARLHLNWEATITRLQLIYSGK